MQPARVFFYFYFYLASTVSNGRFYWIKIKATAEIRDWAELDRFSKLKSKSPIGFEPFVAECLAYNNVVEALKYIPRCDNDKKAAFYIQTK